MLRPHEAVHDEIKGVAGSIHIMFTGSAAYGLGSFASTIDLPEALVIAGASMKTLACASQEKLSWWIHKLSNLPSLRIAAASSVGLAFTKKTPNLWEKILR